jgi:Fe-S oxidoreductase
LSKDEFKSVADLCVHCHMCRLECPATVDIPRLMVEGKGAYVRVNGLPLPDYFMSRIDTVSSLASLVRPLSNWALGNRYARWLLEKSVGLAQGRRLPRLAPRSFQRIAARRKLTRASRRSGNKVLYFVDTYANYYDPQLAEALVAVLEHNAVSVFVHPGQMSSAMPMVALGAIGKAKQLAAHNVALLAEAVRMGYQIIATEPSAALCLQHEYPQLLGDDESRLVAENTSEACTYLWKLHQTGKLQLDFRPINAALGYHQPCHLRAQGVGAPGESLLRLIPGLVVTRVSAGCSGMAGTFGLQKQNYRASLRAGRELIGNLRSPRLQAGTTECSTCKMQMEHGTEKPTIHPVKLMAHSYGLMPKVASLLSTRPAELRIR